MRDRTREADMAILRERARALARPVEDAEPEQAISVVIVVLSGERYALPTEHVEEVHPTSKPAPVPGTPGYWAGVANVRGALYPVLDLHAYLELADGREEGMGKVVLVSSAGLVLALLVDGVEEIRELPISDIRRTPDGTPPAVARATRGITSQLISVIDLEALLSDPRLVVDEQPV